LLIDEVGFRKKGRYSACVGRQYLGCIGKQDNGQVAVVGGLSQEHHYCPVDVALFMPESWDEDLLRRNKAKIPDHIHHQTKPQMALQMILDMKRREIPFDYVGFDALYGSSFELIESLDKQEIRFIGDVKQNVHVHLTKPNFVLPEKAKGTPGRNPKIPLTEQSTISLREYNGSLSFDDFQQIAFREGTKQKIEALFHQKKVWICTNKENGSVLELQLIIRKNPDGTVKYSFCNMHHDNLSEIASRQGQRVFVERIFEEGKNQIGLGDYQIRSWQGFHKHMTLCFMAFYYVALQKIQYQEEMPLTAPIIRKLVAASIISRWESLDDTIALSIKIIAKYHGQIQHNLNREPVT
jgi:SRSO17 transposase